MITVSKPLAHVQVAGNVLVISSDSDSDITYNSSDDDFDGDLFSVYTKEEIISKLDPIEDKKIIDIFMRERETRLTNIDNMIPRYTRTACTKEEIENSVFYESDEVEEMVKNYDMINFKVERVKI